jgi:N-acetylmuramoyl-L-alanine amidase
MASGEAALARLCDPAAKVSAHYLVWETGEVSRLVSEDQRAWHAGVSFWQGRSGLNDVSIGIEIVNPGHGQGYRRFPQPQMASVVELVARAVEAHGIRPDRVVAHSDIAPDRKIDPGERFDWQRLADRGLALAHRPAALAAVDTGVARRALARIGYGLAESRHSLFLAVAAFQRHFRPWRIDGRLDPETMGGILDTDKRISTGR